MTFNTKLVSSLDKKQTRLCVGLDSRYDKIPEDMRQGSIKDTVFYFNKQIIEATQDLACVYKMNVAFYAGFREEGLEALQLTNEFLHETYPDIPLLADCKNSEMGESVNMIKQEMFDWLGFDCVMVTPWFGFDTVREYLDDEYHGVCVYVHDSNPSASEFQDLELKDGRKVYEVVADHVAKKWNMNGNVFVEAGVTYPDALRKTREIIGEELPLLVAGVGPQGGKVEALQGLFGKNTYRLAVNSSRGIIFAGIGKPDYFSAVRNAAITLAQTIDAVAKQS